MAARETEAVVASPELLTEQPPALHHEQEMACYFECIKSWSAAVSRAGDHRCETCWLRSRQCHCSVLRERSGQRLLGEGPAPPSPLGSPRGFQFSCCEVLLYYHHKEIGRSCNTGHILEILAPSCCSSLQYCDVDQERALLRELLAEQDEHRPRSCILYPAPDAPTLSQWLKSRPQGCGPVRIIALDGTYPQAVRQIKFLQRVVEGPQKKGEPINRKYTLPLVRLDIDISGDPAPLCPDRTSEFPVPLSETRPAKASGVTSALAGVMNQPTGDKICTLQAIIMAMRSCGESPALCDQLSEELHQWIAYILKEKIKLGKGKMKVIPNLTEFQPIAPVAELIVSICAMISFVCHALIKCCRIFCCLLSGVAALCCLCPWERNRGIAFMRKSKHTIVMRLVWSHGVFMTSYMAVTVAMSDVTAPLAEMGLLAPVIHTAKVIGLCNTAGYVATVALETHKLTDLVGAGSFVAATSSLLLQWPALSSSGDVVNPRALLVNAAVIGWGVRLALYLFSRVLRVGEDRRLRKFFRVPGEPYLDRTRAIFPLRLSIFWTLQSLWGIICTLPVVFVNASPPAPLDGASKAVAAVTLAGLLIEVVADWQKDSYRSNAKNNGHWCDVGLWRYSRHPNYFGEMLFWWGIFLLSAPALNTPSVVLSMLSPAFISFLLLRVSGVPLLEQAADKKYADSDEYQAYKKSTPVLVPFVY